MCAYKRALLENNERTGLIAIVLVTSCPSKNDLFLVNFQLLRSVHFNQRAHN